MTFDELTELECYIDYCCNEAIKLGYTIAPHHTLNAVNKFCCPLGAVLLANGMESNIDLIKNLFGEDFVHLAFAAAFDSGADSSSLTSYSGMGARFRERFYAGEYK